MFIPRKTTNARFWIGPRWWRGKKSAFSRRAARTSEVSRYFLAWRTRPTIGAHGDGAMGASPVWGASAKDVFGAGDEKTGAAGLAPDALVARPRRTVVVVARVELALVDPQLTIEEM